MAHPIPFAEANLIVERPENMTADECKGVEAFHQPGLFIIRWQFTDAEIEELKKNGGKVYLHFHSDRLAPHYISPDYPFQKNPGG